MNLATQQWEAGRFLTDDRIQAIGALTARQLMVDLSWIERRKESVVLLDDTTLRRQISVDFSLRSEFAAPLIDASPEDGKSLFYAAVFALPKTSGSLMAFDLTDESGAALRLMSRRDNALISAEALVEMSRMALSAQNLDLPADLAQRLRTMAEATPHDGEQIATRLLSGRGEPWHQELAVLNASARLRWWIRTFSHSSVVVALFRSVGPRRKLIKLSYEEHIVSEQRRSTRLGWSPYSVIVNSPLIEAGTFHFEATAPEGLRILCARLTDDNGGGPLDQHGFLRRIHLYRKDAQTAGAGTAVLELAVGHGFIGGAVLAAALTVIALSACLFWARNIATSPTSAPALLLILPGLISSYVARPDQHALTTRLLSFARRLLIITALLAYVAAAKVALGGGAASNKIAIATDTASLQRWLGVLTVGQIVLLIPLVVALVRGRRPLVKLRELWSSTRFRDVRCVAGSTAMVCASLRELITDGPLTKYKQIESDGTDSFTLIRLRLHGIWAVAIHIEVHDGDALVSTTADYVGRSPIPSLPPWQRAREFKKVVSALDAMSAAVES